MYHLSEMRFTLLITLVKVIAGGRKVSVGSDCGFTPDPVAEHVKVASTAIFVQLRHPVFLERNNSRVSPLPIVCFVNYYVGTPKSKSNIKRGVACVDVYCKVATVCVGIVALVEAAADHSQSPSAMSLHSF